MCFCVFPAFSFPGMQDALHIWTREGLLLPLAYRSSAASFSNFVIVLPFFFPFWNQHYSCLRTFSYISNFHYVHFVPFPVYSEMKPIACSLHCFSSSVISILLPCDIDFNCYCIFSLSSISCLESLTFSSFLVFLFMLPCFSF